jgi:hypothetical protein
MAQAQQQSAAPPPLPNKAHPTEIDTQVDHATEFYDHLHAPEPEKPEGPPPLPDTSSHPLATTVAYRATGSNICQLDSVRRSHPGNARLVEHQQDAAPLLRMDPRRTRPRNAARRTRQATPKKRYRISRFIAALFAFMGWTVAAAGGTTLVMCLLQSGVSQRLASPDVLGSAGALLGGLLTALLAFGVRAMFDSANTQSAILAIQQQRAQAQAGAGLY